MKSIIAVINQKGGVGKSTTAAAKAEGVSTNEYIHRVLDRATPKKGE